MSPRIEPRRKEPATGAMPVQPASLSWPPGAPWRLALLLGLARTALVSGLLHQPLAALAFSIAAGLIVLDLVDLKRSHGRLARS